MRETDWSLEIAELIVSNEWKCTNCDLTFNLTGIQKLQHTNGIIIAFHIPQIKNSIIYYLNFRIYFFIGRVQDEVEV